MQKYFLTTVKFLRINEDGKLKTVSEQYLIDALSFTEAEAITIQKMKDDCITNFEITSIKQEKISELFRDNDEFEKWYKCKVSLITIDEVKSKEKRTISTIYVNADNLKQARENLEKGMKGTIADWDSVSISETKVVDFVLSLTLN